MTITLPSLSDLLEKRVKINPRNPTRKKHYLLCLFDGDELVFVGTTTTPEHRLSELEKSTSRTFNGYSLVETEPELIDDLLLELVLTHKPRYNDRLPRNWKLVSKDSLKLNRGISKLDTNRAIRQGKLKPIYYNGITYLLKHEVSAVFGEE